MTQSPPFAAPAPPAAAARPAGFTSTDALLALMVLVWGTNYIVLKAALAVVEPLAVPLVLICTPSVLAQNWRAVTPAAWAALVFSSIGALVVAYLIWYRGVQRLGPSRTAFYSNVTPVVAMLTAWIALGETPTPWQVVGAGGIFGGLYLTRT